LLKKYRDNLTLNSGARTQFHPEIGLLHQIRNFRSTGKQCNEENWIGHPAGRTMRAETRGWHEGNDGDDSNFSNWEKIEVKMEYSLTDERLETHNFHQGQNSEKIRHKN